MTAAAIAPFRPEMDSLWPRIREDERRTVSAWNEIGRRLRAAADKTAELQLVVREYSAVLGGGRPLSRSTVYRKLDGMRRLGAVEGVLPAAAVRRARGIVHAPSLPPLFIAHWRELCGMHQRRKTLSAWRHLMRDELMAGLIIPGYATNWQGIFADENPGRVVPATCPYTDCHCGAAACAPHGWSYASLLELAPNQDAMMGASVGVLAMREENPVMYHTRTPLRPMQVITADDVKIDRFCWYPDDLEHPRCPVGLGFMDVKTGLMFDFTLVPAFRREDGTVSGLQAFWARWAWAHILCNVGIDREDGITALFEHGSAGMDKKEEDRLNEILGPMPDGRRWVRVERSSTSGAPLLKGLFSERGRGRPTHKAMLEATWNLLHNEMAMLTAPSGKDWDNAPQNATGWTREDRALINAAAEIVAKAAPDAVNRLMEAKTHAPTFLELDADLRAVICAMNNRRNHGIANWGECGFVHQMVEMGGALVPIDEAVAAVAGNDETLRETVYRRLAPKSRGVRMSPAEAWASYGGKTLKKFDPFLATRILGPDLAQRVRVDHTQFRARNSFTGTQLVFEGVVRQLDNSQLILSNGDQIDVWVNPLKPDYSLVSKPTGEFLGMARAMRDVAFGELGGANLGLLSLVRGKQRRDVAIAAGGQLRREQVRRAKNAAILAEVASTDGLADAASKQFDELSQNAAPILESL